MLDSVFSLVQGSLEDRIAQIRGMINGYVLLT